MIRVRDHTGTQFKLGCTCNGSYSLCAHAGRCGNFPSPKSLDCVSRKLQYNLNLLFSVRPRFLIAGNPLNMRGGNGKCGIVRFFAGVPASFILIRSLITESHLLVCSSFNLGPVTIFIPQQSGVRAAGRNTKNRPWSQLNRNRRLYGLSMNKNDEIYNRVVEFDDQDNL
jgi:hypothetical protein